VEGHSSLALSKCNFKTFRYIHLSGLPFYVKSNTTGLDNQSFAPSFSVSLSLELSSSFIRSLLSLF